ncbi:MAG: hypothetical protein LJF06_11185 [Gemmatimonadetes bacterium]|nr:hypothetical protein [Gemmatimonadota bacterium]
MQSTGLLSIAAVLTLGACTGAGLQQPLALTSAELTQVKAQAQTEPGGRPFKMDMVIGSDLSEGTCDVEVPTGDPGNPTVLVQIPTFAPAWGTASHVGRVGQDIWHDYCSFALHGDLPAIDLGGHTEIRAANGDAIEGNWSGYLLLAGEQAGHFFNTAVITGGTGRFENASGELVIHGWNNLGPGPEPSWYKAEGTISY